MRWHNAYLRRKKFKAGFKTLNGNIHSCLQELFSIRSTGYNIRNCEVNKNYPSQAIAEQCFSRYIGKLFSLSHFSKVIDEHYNTEFDMTPVL
jgi:hypothetical protein